MIIFNKKVGTPYNKNSGFVNSSDYSTNSFLRTRKMGINSDMMNRQQYFYACPNCKYAMQQQEENNTTEEWIFPGV
jgi:hypothetical protein